MKKGIFNLIENPFFIFLKKELMCTGDMVNFYIQEEYCIRTEGRSTCCSANSFEKRYFVFA
jgi:hypothetical protein